MFQEILSLEGMVFGYFLGWIGQLFPEIYRDTKERKNGRYFNLTHKVYA